MTELEKAVDLDSRSLGDLVETKVTCPFLGPAVAGRMLPVRGSAANPLASVDEVRQLGNSGGGDLGEVLTFFANGNHNRMRGPTGRLDVTPPETLFSLELPGSQGSHAGHSGILQRHPGELASGRFSEADFARLAAHVRDGLLTRSAVGEFIAENLQRDPNATVNQGRIAKLFVSDIADVLSSAGGALFKKVLGSKPNSGEAEGDLEEKLTKLLGEDNLVGSAGEFGLLFAFLANSPGTREVDGEPALSFDDVRLMFVDKRLPDGWQDWKKTRRDWLANTTGLIASALHAFAKRNAL